MLSANLKDNLKEVMKLRNELLKATIFKDNHIVNHSFDEVNDDNQSPRKNLNEIMKQTNENYLKEMDSVLEASSILNILT